MGQLLYTLRIRMTTLENEEQYSDKYHNVYQRKKTFIQWTVSKADMG